MCRADISLIYGIASPGKAKRSDRPQGTIQSQKISTVEPIIPQKRIAKKSSFSSWGRNPFTKKAILPDARSGRVILNGIVWDEQSPLAIINGQMVGEEESIGDIQIKSIDKDRVVILKDVMSRF